MNLERSYVRELNHNYMIVIPETDTIIESFEIEMIGQNQIQGLLEFEIRYVDGKQTFLYEISSKQSITNLYASSEMNFEMITGLIQATYQMIYTVEEYLLDMNHILIDPEYLFFDIEKCKTNKDGWSVHPLTLLLADGNGRGMGDYKSKNSRRVGTWKRNVVVTSDNRPDENEYKEIFIDWLEEW